MADRFDKFTERARQVLTSAQEEAQRFNHNYLGTEHLLLGLLRERDGVAAAVLRNLGVSSDSARTAVEFIVGRGEKPAGGEIGLTPRAKKVIELSVEEARRMNHSYIGTEHLLLGLAREGEGIAFGVLESLGVNLERLRAETAKVLASGLIDTYGRSSVVALREPQPLVPDPTKKARAAAALGRAQAKLQSVQGTAVEQTLIAGFVIPMLARLLESLNEVRFEEELNNVRADLLAQLGPLRGLIDALRAEDRLAIADAVANAIEAYADAVSSGS